MPGAISERSRGRDLWESIKENAPSSDHGGRTVLEGRRSAGPRDRRRAWAAPSPRRAVLHADEPGNDFGLLATIGPVLPNSPRHRAFAGADPASAVPVNLL